MFYSTFCRIIPKHSRAKREVLNHRHRETGFQAKPLVSGPLCKASNTSGSINYPAISLKVQPRTTDRGPAHEGRPHYVGGRGNIVYHSFCLCQRKLRLHYYVHRYAKP